MLSTISLLGMNHEELLALVSEAGQPSYRAKQIMGAVYRQRVESLAEISTLPSEFREWLEQSGVTVGAARIENKFVSQDGTVRYLIGFADGQTRGDRLDARGRRRGSGRWERSGGGG